ncbi:aspartyl protease family protein [Bosea sp. BE125]|uniref:retroviral-like aspartic protease family protein n=1 Tax=Bosea sp. BE125 TaxID=2817909 RepID=UPI0028604140|nr:retroviral-like aspartic protease family protein [Bosea sp. BE125]MDR6872880.1 aspartyl protease family protein [Bosea sp. BE125]
MRQPGSGFKTKSCGARYVAGGIRARVGDRPPVQFVSRFIGVVFGLIVASGGGALAQSDLDRVASVQSALGIEFPYTFALARTLGPHVEALFREPCDREAVVGLAEGLRQAGYRREAAKALIRFSDNCRGHLDGLRRAANLLLDLSDWTAAAEVASKIIEEQPHSDNGYYLRALARDRAGKPNDAIDDYLTAIALFGDKDRISSAGYFGVSRAYEKSGQFCEAIVPIEAWIALNPARNDNSRTQAMIGALHAKGQCAAKAVAVDETIPITRKGQTITVPATINGIKGMFLIDTGATFVSLKQSFADRAKIAVDMTSKVQMHTANGIAEARRGRASRIELRRVQAMDVPVIVQSDSRGTYGNGIDGLLGMSFLSRFDVVIDQRNVRIKPRGRKDKP